MSAERHPTPKAKADSPVGAAVQEGEPCERNAVERGRVVPDGDVLSVPYFGAGGRGRRKSETRALWQFAH